LLNSSGPALRVSARVRRRTSAVSWAMPAVSTCARSSDGKLRVTPVVAAFGAREAEAVNAHVAAFISAHDERQRRAGHGVAPAGVEDPAVGVHVVSATTLDNPARRTGPPAPLARVRADRPDERTVIEVFHLGHGASPTGVAHATRVNPRSRPPPSLARTCATRRRAAPAVRRRRWHRGGRRPTGSACQRGGA
jgi:hypothetical protein